MLQEDPDPFPSKFRLMAVHRLLTDLRCPEATKKMLCEHRGRNRDTWKHNQRSGIFASRRGLALDPEAPVETGVAPLEGKQSQSRIDRSSKLKMQTDALPVLPQSLHEAKDLQAPLAVPPPRDLDTKLANSVHG